MTWLRRALLAVAAAALYVAPVTAQVMGRPVEVSAGAGLFKYDIRAHMKRGPAYVASLGWRATPWLTLEGNAAFGPTQADTFPRQDHNFTEFGLDLRWNLRSPEDRVAPFVITGFGYGRSHTLGHAPEKLERGAGSVGMGVLYNVMGPRTYLRVQVRDVWFRDRDAFEFSHNFAATVGLQLVLGGRYRDQDLDGVRDWLDDCPDTPIGCIVTSSGCPTDRDGDGVCDGNDKCADTPAGCEVGRDGCPIDADGDGVCNGLDQCADTPRGCTVTSAGCPSDADSDGVCDGVDACPDTPTGCVVDSVGCTTDADADGVCDALDRCPNTPAGIAVGPNGCPTAIGRQERELLVNGVVRVANIVFRAGGTDIAPRSFTMLDSLGAVLQQYPGLKIEIGGPTDLTGQRAVRARLALDECRAVLAYLQEKFPLIDGAQYTMRGYDAPAPSVERGEDERRRIEFKVVNPEELPAEREKRGIVGQGIEEQSETPKDQ